MRPIAAATWLLFVGCSLFSTLSVAETRLTRERNGDQYQFQYVWQTPTGIQYNITMAQDIEAIHQSFRKYRGYDLERANRELRYQLLRYAKQQGWRGIDVTLSAREQQLNIVRRGRLASDDVVANMHAAHERLFTEYLREHYYNRMTGVAGQVGIKPDHIAIAEASHEIILPLANAFRDLLGENTQRTYLEAVLSFVQGIPYQDLADRLTSSGAGFNPPARLLLEHQGDCDSKVTLMGALLRELMPDVPVYAVYVPDHAFLALRMSQREGEQSITIDDQSLLVVEPTGPALLKIGELGETAARYVSSGQYSTERFR